ncbi:hypothetical protein M0Q50_03545 [bacterium]|jgi:hypothetical protein|nr:hypothetical protein [bacterium]
MRKNTWTTILDKPKNFKQIDKRIYNCIVYVYNDKIGWNNRGLIDIIDIHYKITENRELDIDWTTNYIQDLIGESYYELDFGYFRRDGGNFVFITGISIRDEKIYFDYKKNISRIKKLNSLI